MKTYLLENIENIIASLILLGSIASTIFKKHQNKKISKSQQKELYFETVLITFTIAFILINLKVSDIEASIDALNNKIDPPKEIICHYNASDEEFIDLIIEDLISIDNKNTLKSQINVMYTRAHFTPTPFLGIDNLSDRSIFEKFRNGSYELRYIIGFPDHTDVNDNNRDDLRIQREQMNLFAFHLLTDDMWYSKDVLSLTEKYVSFYYIPKYEYPNTWFITTNSDKCFSGFSFSKGDWDGQYSHPNTSEIVKVNNYSLSQYIRSQHESFKDWAMSYVKRQKEKPSHEREPIMIFSSDKQDVLIPKSKKSISTLCNTYIQKWKTENESDVLPPKLEELNNLVNIMNNKK